MGVKSATRVSDASALQDAIQRRVPHIVVEGEISAMPMITLAEGQRLSESAARREAPESPAEADKSALPVDSSGPSNP